MAEAMELVPAFTALERSGMLKPTSLELDPEISYEQYERIGVMLTFLYQANRWWLVDWLIFGEGVFADRVDQAIAATGLSERRIRNLRAIGLSVPPSRRVVDLSVDWHAQVVALKPKDQRRWLSRAKKEKQTVPAFTRCDLRLLIHEGRVARGEVDPGEPVRRTPGRTEAPKGERGLAD